MKNNTVIQLTKQLVQFESTKDNQAERQRVADFCAEYISKKTKGKAHIKIFEKNGKQSLIATYKKTKQPHIFLNAHLDVIEAEKEQFKVTEKNGKLYGRGVSDMKGMAAAQIVAFCALSEAAPDIGLMLTADEEVGGFDGVRYLLEDKKYSCDYAFVPDDGPDWELIIAEKGALHLKVSTIGKAAHGSRPWLGDNAIDKALEVYHDIAKAFATKKKTTWRETINLGKIEGGKATNQVPDSASLYVDVRFTEKYTQKTMLTKIKKIVGKRAQVEVMVAADVNYVDPHEPFVKAVTTFFEKKLNKKIKKVKVHGATDARYFAPHNIPTIIIKPPSGGNHEKGEWMSVSGLTLFTETLTDFLATYYKNHDA